MMKAFKAFCHLLIFILLALNSISSFAQINNNKLNDAVRLSHNSEYDKADNLFSELIVSNPNDTAALTGRGYNSLFQKHYNLAEDDFKKALALDSTNTDAMTGLASTLSVNGKYAEAEQIFNKVLGKSSTNYKALEGRAYNNLWSGNYKGAENDFKLLVEAGYDKKEFHYALNKTQEFLSPLVYEAGGSVGAMNAFTDLGGGKGTGKGIKDYNLKTTRPCVGTFFTATYKNFIAARAELTYGIVTSYDSLLKNVAASTLGRYERNLSFRSSIIELTVMAEFHPLYFLSKNDVNSQLKTSPYILLGLGVFHFNPKTKLNGDWVALHPLRTEGEGFSEYPDRKQYHLTQINFPLGVGVRYQVKERISFRAEFIYRILRTDYLDDASKKAFVNPALFSKYLSGTKANQAEQLYDRHRFNTSFPSQRGNPGNNDSYFSLNFKLGYMIGRHKVTPDQTRLSPL